MAGVLAGSAASMHSRNARGGMLDVMLEEGRSDYARVAFDAELMHTVRGHVTELLQRKRRTL